MAAAGKRSVDLERENAELRRLLAERTAERDEAVAQQTATAEVLQVINASPGDLAPVFEAMLEKAMRLCEAAFGMLGTVGGGELRTVATRGLPQPFMEFRKSNPSVHGPGRARILAGERVVHILDLRNEEFYQTGDPNRRAVIDLGGARTVLLVGLEKDGVVLGHFGVYRQEVRPFTDKQIALLQNFAAQAVIAMENARLLTETREALEQQTATAEVLQVINSSPGDLAPVFDAILEKAHTLCGATLGSLRLYDGKYVRAVAIRGHEGDYADELRRGNALSEISVASLLQDAPFVQILDLAGSDDPLQRAVFERSGSRTGLIVPLRKDGALLGMIFAARREVRPFTDKQIALLENFAAQAVIAMENARLLTETREALEQQTATAEILSVINSSAGDLAPVFDAMLERALRLCNASLGHVWGYDGEGLTPLAIRGGAEVGEWFRQVGRLIPSPETPVGRIVWGEDLVHIGDVTKEPAYASLPLYRRYIDAGHIRTSLAVPLRQGGTLSGIFAVYRQEVQPFTEKQIALLKNFAAQAVIAIENARLLTETREALEQQTATAEVLQVINSSPGDLVPVFDAMLEKALQLCGAAFGILHTYDGAHIHTVAHRGLSREYVEFLSGTPHQPGTSGPLAAFLDGEPFVHWDAAESQSYREGHPLARALVEIEGGRTLLAVPLRKDAVVVGMFVVYRREVRPFGDKQIALLENFAAQAVIAMENARLLTETREALEQQTATSEVLQVINASPGDLAPVFDAILEKAHSLCGVASGALQLYDGEKFRAVATNGLPEPLTKWLRDGLPPGSSQQRVVAGEADVIHIADLAASDSPRARHVVEMSGVRTLLYVALRKNRKLLGVISASRFEVRPFSEKEIALLQNFAAQAVIAMENARLITETREALDQQTATAEVLQVINASPGDLAPVFDAMLERALRLCGAAYGNLLSYDGELCQVLATTHDLPGHRFQPSRGTALDSILKGESIVSIHDLASSDTYRFGSPHFRGLIEAGGYRSLLNVALRKDDGVLLGVIAIFSIRVQPFTAKQIALLRNFAAQAVIAMENARLLGELRARNDEIAGWNRELEERVQAQVAELERAGRLKRFLAPQLAELIVARGDENILETHRRDIVVVFCDLRGFTAFAETAEPEEVLDLLREYHGALGPVVAASEGTLDHFSGDGIMVFFNDPVPVPDASERAVRMAIEMRAAMALLQARWRRQGRAIGFGSGIARGYATLGQIGFADRIDYTAIGTVCNLAARLCAEAQDGQILISRRVAAAVEDSVRLEEVGDLALKGLMQAVAVYNVTHEP